jgi:hypothetical protein
MRKGRDLIGKPIIAVNNGLKVTTIKDLIFSQQQDILVAVLTEEPGWFNSGAVVLISQIQTIGADGILIASEADITPAHQVPLVRSIFILIPIPARLKVMRFLEAFLPMLTRDVHLCRPVTRSKLVKTTPLFPIVSSV